MEEKTMSPDEAVLFLTGELEDEIACAEAYRSTAMALIDHIAASAISRVKKMREERRKREYMLMNAPISTATH